MLNPSNQVLIANKQKANLEESFFPVAFVPSNKVELGVKTKTSFFVATEVFNSYGWQLHERLFLLC